MVSGGRGGWNAWMDNQKTAKKPSISLYLFDRGKEISPNIPYREECPEHDNERDTTEIRKNKENKLKRSLKRSM